MASTQAHTTEGDVIMARSPIILSDEEDGCEERGWVEAIVSPEEAQRLLQPFAGQGVTLVLERSVSLSSEQRDTYEAWVPDPGVGGRLFHEFSLFDDPADAPHA